MKLTPASKNLSKVIDQLWKNTGKRDGFAINLTPEMIDVVKDNLKTETLTPNTGWVIINYNDVPSFYFVEDGAEFVYTIQKYVSDIGVEIINNLISSNLN